MRHRRIWIVSILLIVLTANICLHEHYDHSCAVCAATHNSHAAAQPVGLPHLVAPLTAEACGIAPHPLTGYSATVTNESSQRAPPV